MPDLGSTDDRHRLGLRCLVVVAPRGLLLTDKGRTGQDDVRVCPLSVDGRANQISHAGRLSLIFFGCTVISEGSKTHHYHSLPSPAGQKHTMTVEEEQVTTIEPSTTLSLIPEEERDELSTDKYPYRLVQIGKDVCVYGGDDGLLVRAQDQKTVRRWEDDALRAVAVSPNQRTVVVGVDSGQVEIYSFAHYNGTAAVHPFCAITPTDDEDDAFMSQSDKLTSPQPSDKMSNGPRGDAAVRDIVFLNDDMVAIAFESDLKLVNLAEDDMPTYLSKESRSQHDGSGVRGLAWNAELELLTSLGMDGSVCYWKCPLANPEESKLWRKDANLQVAKRDLGEVLGADAWDRSCRPWQNGSYLAIPGANLWQLVHWTTEPELDYKQLFQTDTVHKKTMVVIRSKGAHWITADRAGDVVLWQLVSVEGGRVPMCCVILSQESNTFYYLFLLHHTRNRKP